MKPEDGNGMFAGHSGAAAGKTPGGKTALKDASRLVARAEQYGAGLSLKLQKKGYGKAEIRAVLETLAESGMLDDMRYSRLWIEARIKRKAFSPRELMAALRGKGIDRYTVSAALKDVLGGGEEPCACELSLLRRFAAKNGFPASADGNLREKFRREGFSAEVLERYFDE
jgi:SOS response regulatory protein OraA/RecX